MLKNNLHNSKLCSFKVNCLSEKLWDFESICEVVLLHDCIKWTQLQYIILNQQEQIHPKIEFIVPWGH